MKAILEFDLTDLEDQKRHMGCIKSTAMSIILWEIEHNLHRKWKYNEDNKFVEGANFVLSHILEEMKNHGINTEELI